MSLIKKQYLTASELHLYLQKVWENDPELKKLKFPLQPIESTPYPTDIYFEVN